jgi:hypothetical protein
LSEARHGEDARSDHGGFRLRAEIVAARTLAAFVASSYVAELRGFEAEIELSAFDAPSSLLVSRRPCQDPLLVRLVPWLIRSFRRSGLGPMDFLSSGTSSILSVGVLPRY